MRVIYVYREINLSTLAYTDLTTRSHLIAALCFASSLSKTRRNVP